MPKINYISILLLDYSINTDKNKLIDLLSLLDLTFENKKYFDLFNINFKENKLTT